MSGFGVLTGASGLLLGLSTAVILVGAGSGGAAGTLALGPGVPARFSDAILQAAARCPRLPPTVLAAQLAVESRWDPAAVAGDGRRGLAGFRAETWARWGVDADGDGRADPLTPVDAIASQARRMCRLSERVAPLRGDSLNLTLGAYRSGIRQVLASGTVPDDPDTRAYIRQVRTLAATPGYALAVARGPGPVDVRDLPAGHANPRTPDEAVAWALGQVGSYRDAGYCLRFVDLAYGRTSGPASAYQVWTNSPADLHHPADARPPRGALVVWSPAIGGGHGHIAISLGDGRMVTTTDGAVSVQPIAGFADSAYWGWMPPYFYQ